MNRRIRFNENKRGFRACSAAQLVHCLRQQGIDLGLQRFHVRVEPHGAPRIRVDMEAQQALAFDDGLRLDVETGRRDQGRQFEGGAFGVVAVQADVVLAVLRLHVQGVADVGAGQQRGGRRRRERCKLAPAAVGAAQVQGVQLAIGRHRQAQAVVVDKPAETAARRAHVRSQAGARIDAVERLFAVAIDDHEHVVGQARRVSPEDVGRNAGTGQAFRAGERALVAHSRRKRRQRLAVQVDRI